LQIVQALVAKDPGNAMWQGDRWTLLWKLAEIRGSGVTWPEVVEAMSDMAKRGVLSTTDHGFLAEARARALKAGAAEAG